MYIITDLDFQFTVATVDAPQVHDHDDSTLHQGHDAVNY